VHYHNEFENGEFHLADTFLVNHGKDGNVISFKPRKTGSLKFLVKESVLVQPRDDKTPVNLDIKIFPKDLKETMMGTASNEMIQTN
jgi:hypothetical protein